MEGWRWGCCTCRVVIMSNECTALEEENRTFTKHQISIKNLIMPPCLMPCKHHQALPIHCCICPPGSQQLSFLWREASGWPCLYDMNYYELVLLYKLLYIDNLILQISLGNLAGVSVNRIGRELYTLARVRGTKHHRIIKFVSWLLTPRNLHWISHRRCSSGKSIPMMHLSAKCCHVVLSPMLSY